MEREGKKRKLQLSLFSSIIACFLLSKEWVSERQRDRYNTCTPGSGTGVTCETYFLHSNVLVIVTVSVWWSIDLWIRLLAAGFTWLFSWLTSSVSSSESDCKSLFGTQYTRRVMKIASTGSTGNPSAKNFQVLPDSGNSCYSLFHVKPIDQLFIEIVRERIWWTKGRSPTSR